MLFSGNIKKETYLLNANSVNNLDQMIKTIPIQIKLAGSKI